MNSEGFPDAPDLQSEIGARRVIRKQVEACLRYRLKSWSSSGDVVPARRQKLRVEVPRVVSYCCTARPGGCVPDCYRGTGDCLSLRACNGSAKAARALAEQPRGGEKYGYEQSPGATRTGNAHPTRLGDQLGHRKPLTGIRS